MATDSQAPLDDPKILLTGASGYVGGRLRRLLELQKRPLRCLTRRPDYLKDRTAATTEIFQGDVLDKDSLTRAARGIDTAYYLVHSMGSKGEFEASDRRGAENFARAALESGIQKIIYLGGLGRGSDLSAHLKSRQEVGRILRESGVPALEFRASIIIGSGSLSFEMIRALVDKLPVMITPAWVRVRAQPIAVEDVLAYLVAALDYQGGESRVFEIGGGDRASYSEIMLEYARQRGMRRWIIPVPFLTTRLSSLWLGLVTPIYARTGRQLIDSVRNETVVEDSEAEALFRIDPRGIRESIARALSHEDQEFAETRWSDALSSVGETASYGGVKFGSRFVDSRTRAVPHSSETAFRPIQRIGGRTGWYYGSWLWSLRGFMDLLAGGPGVRRGRRHPEAILPGDTIDFWRVEAFTRDRMLRLRAEMRLPGRAWLQFEVEPQPGESSLIRQTAIFEPKGLLGLAYWYALYPVHQFVFSGMLRRIAAAAGTDTLPERRR